MATSVGYQSPLRDAPIQSPLIGNQGRVQEVWASWFNDIRRLLGGATVIVTWAELDYTGSTLLSIADRKHNDLQNIQGGSSTERYHLTSAQQSGLTGGGATTLHKHSHENMDSLQGGTTGEHYHLTSAEHTDLTDGGDSSAHYHSADRSRSNHTGTQTASTISDFTSAAQTAAQAATQTEITEYNAPTTGFGITIANTTNRIILEPAGVLASGTLTMPASPVNNQVCGFTSTMAITALTVSPNAGQTLNGGLTAAAIAANGFATWVYRAANTTWYRTG